MHEDMRGVTHLPDLIPVMAGEFSHGFVRRHKQGEGPLVLLVVTPSAFAVGAGGGVVGAPQKQV